jgi:hypothetical protein
MYSEANEIGNNPEMIWVRRYQWPAKRSPFAAPVILNQHVTIEHINAYSRADGSPYTGIEIPAGGNVGASSGVRNAPYWLDREPRFYASIAYNGMERSAPMRFPTIGTSKANKSTGGSSAAERRRPITIAHAQTCLPTTRSN